MRSLNKTASYPPLILFDSFDEIRGSSTKDTSECQAKVLTLLIFLKDKTTATLFVTTRLEGEQVLENKLLVFATKLKEFEDHEQLEYLKNFWLVSSSLTVSQKDFETKLESFAEELINNEILMKHRDFMGVALQLRMVAETFWQDLRFLVESKSLKISSNDILGNISKLYHKFIERKYDIYLNGKLDLTAKFPSQESKILRDFYNKMHRKLAVNEIFPNEGFSAFFQNHLEEGNSSDDEENELQHRFGLVVDSQFIHRTFAEYFAAGLLCNCLVKMVSNPTKYQHTKRFLLKNIFKKTNWVNFIFMDQALNTNAEWMLIKESNLLFNAEAEKANNKSELEYESSLSIPSYGSLLELQNLVEDCMERQSDGKNYYYNRDKPTTRIENLYCKFFSVTNIDELKITLDFLLKAHNKSIYHLANKAISISITEAAMHYFKYANQNQTLSNDYFKEVLDCLITDSSQLISNFDLNQYKFDDDYLFKIDKLFLESKSLLFPGNLKWLESEGLNISKLLSILTPCIAGIFVSSMGTVSESTDWEFYYAINIFKKLILSLLTAMHDKETMPCIDKLSLLEMSQQFAEFISKNSKCRLPTINTKQLKALLGYIKSLLENKEPTKEELSTVLNCLIRLKLWDLNLIDSEQNLLIQDSNGEFNFEFSFAYKKQIVELIRWKLGNPQVNCTDKCSEIISLIS